MREGLMYMGLMNSTDFRFITDDLRDVPTSLKESIQEFPEMVYLRPIVVNKDNEILGGKLRFRALVELGEELIPFIRIEDITPEQEQMFIEKDNAHWGDYALPDYNLPSYDVREVKQKTIKINAPLDDYDFITRDLNTIKDKMGLQEHSQVLKLLIHSFFSQNYI